MDEQLIAELRAAVPDVVTDPDRLRSYRRDEADLAEHGEPLVVVRPRTTGQVSAVRLFGPQAWSIGGPVELFGCLPRISAGPGLGSWTLAELTGAADAAISRSPGG